MHRLQILLVLQPFEEVEESLDRYEPRQRYPLRTSSRFLCLRPSRPSPGNQPASEKIFRFLVVHGGD